MQLLGRGTTSDGEACGPASMAQHPAGYTERLRQLQEEVARAVATGQDLGMPRRAAANPVTASGCARRQLEGGRNALAQECGFLTPPHIPTPPSADVPPNVASIPDTFPRWWTGRFIDPVKPAPSWDELDRQAAQEEADQRTGAQLRTMPPGEAAEVPLFLRVGKAPLMGSLPRSLPPPPPTGLWSNAPVCAGSLAALALAQRHPLGPGTLHVPPLSFLGSIGS